MVGLQYACIANCSVLRLEIVNLRSIRTKLALLVVTAVVSAVLLVCLAFAWTDASRRFSAKRLELQGIATTIATAVSLPLAAGDHTSIARTLGAVGRIPGLTYARVADVKGLTVQQFGAGIVVSRRSENTTPNQSISPFSGLFLETYPVMSPIIFGGRQIELRQQRRQALSRGRRVRGFIDQVIECTFHDCRFGQTSAFGEQFDFVDHRLIGDL
mgnify:CR=1 FL=1